MDYWQGLKSWGPTLQNLDPLLSEWVYHTCILPYLYSKKAQLTSGTFHGLHRETKLLFWAVFVWTGSDTTSFPPPQTSGFSLRSLTPLRQPWYREDMNLFFLRAQVLWGGTRWGYFVEKPHPRHSANSSHVWRFRWPNILPESTAPSLPKWGGSDLRKMSGWWVCCVRLKRCTLASFDMKLNYWWTCKLQLQLGLQFSMPSGFIKESSTHLLKKFSSVLFLRWKMLSEITVV